MKDILLILPTLLAIFLLMLVVKIAAVILKLTGMDEKKAIFQALSALTGAGFTTKESELIMNHPLRRRVISWLMVLGYAGIITIMVTFTSSLVTSIGYMKYINLVILGIGLYIVYRIANHKKLVKKWSKMIENKIIQYPAFDEPRLEDLLHSTDGYGLFRISIKKNLSLASQPLSDIDATKHKLLILGIERNEEWIPLPDQNELITEDDKIVVYGSINVLKTVFNPE